MVAVVLTKQMATMRQISKNKGCWANTCVLCPLLNWKELPCVSRIVIIFGKIKTTKESICPNF